MTHQEDGLVRLPQQVQGTIMTRDRLHRVLGLIRPTTEKEFKVPLNGKQLTTHGPPGFQDLAQQDKGGAYSSPGRIRPQSQGANVHSQRGELLKGQRVDVSQSKVQL